MFELPLVQHQIRYTNIMPLVNIWRMGYCFHLSHVNFLNRYKILSPETWPFYRIGSVIEGIATIIRELPLPSAEFILGTTKVFMRSPRTVCPFLYVFDPIELIRFVLLLVFFFFCLSNETDVSSKVFEMEEFRRNRLNQLIVIIQTKFRSYIHRKRYLRLKQSQIIISRAWRTKQVCFCIRYIVHNINYKSPIYSIYSSYNSKAISNSFWSYSDSVFDIFYANV